MVLRIILNTPLKLYSCFRCSLINQTRNRYVTLSCLHTDRCQKPHTEDVFRISAVSLTFLRNASNRTWEIKEEEKIRPEFDSGDLEESDISKVNKSLPQPGFELCEELKNADESVRKLFSLQFTFRKFTVDTKLHEIVKEIQMHKYDFESTEVQIARLTISIRNLQELIKTVRPIRKNRCLHGSLRGFIRNRYNLLKILRNENYYKFLWIIDKLKITFKTDYIPPSNPCRKEKLILMVEEEAKNIREKKLSEYAVTLKAMQPDFLKRKAQLQAQIAEEESIVGTNLKDYLQNRIDYIESKYAIYSSK